LHDTLVEVEDTSLEFPSNQSERQRARSPLWGGFNQVCGDDAAMARAAAAAVPEGIGGA